MLQPTDEQEIEIIVVFQQKGGNGKSVAAVQLAYSLAKKGKRVLFVDADPQGTGSLHFLGVSYRELKITFFNAITSTRNIEQVTRIDPIVISERLHLLPAHDELEQAEVLLTSKHTFEWREQLMKLLGLYADDYDYVVVDTPGSRVSIFPTLALVAADQVIIPVKTTFEAQQATIESMGLVEDIKKNLNPHLQISCILPNQFEQTLHHQEIIDILKETYPSLVWEASRKSIKYAEALVAKEDVRVLARSLGKYWDGLAESLIEKAGRKYASQTH
ncbi:MAG: ParA family protein [Chloroflexi bacterium]|nr:MAG: ParA family protein [Chloroflexota bacterium]